MIQFVLPYNVDSVSLIEMIRPDYKEFSRLASEATLVPVVKNIAFFWNQSSGESRLGDTRFWARGRTCSCARRVMGTQSS
jgi:hypothetical protein